MFHSVNTCVVYAYILSIVNACKKKNLAYKGKRISNEEERRTTEEDEDEKEKKEKKKRKERTIIIL
jgi:hypothetical protein